MPVHARDFKLLMFWPRNAVDGGKTNSFPGLRLTHSSLRIESKQPFRAQTTRFSTRACDPYVVLTA